MVKKGIILSITENRARVAPADDIDMVSGFLIIPPHLLASNYTRMASAIAKETGLASVMRQIAEEQALKKGDEVAFISFPDCTGAILAKL